MNSVTLHILWGEAAISRYRMGKVDNLVLLAHAAYDFQSTKESEAFLYGVKVSRKPESWLLVTNVIDIRKLGQPLKSKLFAAIDRGDALAVEELLEAGVTPNVRAPNGLTPLQTAAKTGQDAVAVVLLAHGAQMNLVTDDAQRETAMHLAVDSYRPEAEKLTTALIDADADIDAFNAKGQTPLMKALDRENLPLALHFLSKGAKLDYADDTGNTARSIFVQKFEGIINDPLVDRFHQEIVSHDALKIEVSQKKARLAHPSPYPI